MARALAPGTLRPAVPTSALLLRRSTARLDCASLTSLLTVLPVVLVRASVESSALRLGQRLGAIQGIGLFSRLDSERWIRLVVVG